jgi:copper homeostasis protein (lipoprotein)
MACNNRPMRLLLRLLLWLCMLGSSSSWAEDVTYAGTWPCGSCAQRQVSLSLFAEHSFRMRLRDLDAQGVVVAEQFDLGRWIQDGSGRLLLRGGREAPQRFDLQADGSLRGFDAQAQPLLGLKRQPVVDRIEGPMRMRGLYFYLADAASFSECLSGRRWPVQIEGAHLDLERAYLAQGEGGRWVLATLQGRFVMHEPEPGLPPREAIVVERFDRLWPGETCAADAPSTAALLNTRWRLVEIDGQPVSVAAEQREPWLQLSAGGNRVRGFGGCNAIAGRFEQGSDGFAVKARASTRRSCPGVAGVQEAGYLAALQSTATRLIVGDALQLRDAQGRMRLRFEALYLR